MAGWLVSTASAPLLRERTLSCLVHSGESGALAGGRGHGREGGEVRGGGAPCEEYLDSARGGDPRPCNGFPAANAPLVRKCTPLWLVHSGESGALAKGLGVGSWEGAQGAGRGTQPSSQAASAGSPSRCTLASLHGRCCVNAGGGGGASRARGAVRECRRATRDARGPWVSGPPAQQERSWGERSRGEEPRGARRQEEHVQRQQPH